MNKPIVYLAGGMTGLDAADAREWRWNATSALQQRGIETLSPMRGHPRERFGDGVIKAFDDVAESGGVEGVMLRDLTDVRRADALLVNCLGAKFISVGTAIELGWAYLLHKPAVIIIEREGNPHDQHPMVRASIRYRAENLADGIEAVAAILGR
jgi:nucleoside 2-deoxyribosyltransferase